MITSNIKYAGVLTLEQKESLIGITYADDSFFLPLLDQDNDWTITSIEIEACVNPDFQWVKDLPTKPWNPYYGPTVS
jgi:hypothetical protein